MTLRRRENMTGIPTGTVLLLCLVGALSGATWSKAATETPFDFTGHWTGVAQETGETDTTLTADLSTGAHPRLFVGTLVGETNPDPPVACEVKGKLKGLTKVKMRLSCSNGTIKAHGLLDAGVPSITGTFARRGRHRIHHGTFALTEQVV